MRTSLLGRSLVISLLPAALAAWVAVGCSDDPEPADTFATEAGADVLPPLGDGGADGGASCANDLDVNDGVWKHLECSGLYASLADKTVAADVKPYKPGVEFWSDGAEKQRWVYLPAGMKIDISDFDEWVFPKGTKVWKEFKLGGKRIETRLYRKLDDGSWGHTTYRWTDDERDAVREDTGEKIPGLGPDGGIYEIPNRGKCEDCHFGRKDQLLGFDAVSLGLASATGETLAALTAEGRLSAAPPKTALAFPGGSFPDAAVPAVGFLHANCGACHNGNSNAAALQRAHFLVRASDLAPPDGGAAVPLQALDLWTQAYCKNAFGSEPGVGAPYKYIRGGEPTRSAVSILSGFRVPAGSDPNNSQMPPIVSRAVDLQGHKLLDDWIKLLPPCP